MRKIALFTDPYPYYGAWDEPFHTANHTINDYHATFTTTDGKKGVFHADLFEPTSRDRDVEMKITFDINGETSRTGGGEAVRIFSTIIKIALNVYDGARKSHPDELIIMAFHATDDSAGRKKLYFKFAQGIAKMRGGIVHMGSAQDGIFIIDFPPKPAHA